MKNTRTYLPPMAVALLAFALLRPASFAQPLHVAIDYSTFRYDSNSTYMEFHYSFDMTGLKLARKDTLFADTLLFRVSMSKEGHDSTRYYDAWQVPVNTSDTAAANLRHALVGQIGIAIPPGNYSMLLEMSDRNDSSSMDSVTERIMVPTYSFDKLQTSDIELCSEISAGDPSQQGAFYKNTYNVVPNPKLVYGAGLPIIYYYVEVYNIPDTPVDSLFTVQYEVRDAFGQVRKDRTVTRKKFGATSVEVGTVNGSDLKTGSYTFIFTVVDSAANTYATSSRRFFVYNPGLGAPESAGSSLAGASVLSTVFATMGMEQVNKEFEEARYISTPKEKEQFRELQSLPAKRQYLYDFWKKRDSNPESGVYSVRTQYLQRVAYANDNFRVGSREGWRTDRGRVYIVYGPPDQIDRHPNEGNLKPYEIWYYNSIQGGVTFDFIDRTGFGNYQLVNSSARDEIHDDNWQQYLTTQ